MLKLSHRPRRPARRSWPRLSNPFEQLEKLGKAAQAIGAIFAVATPFALATMTLLTNHYLSAFGQPGLTSLGQFAGFLTATLPIILVMVGVLAGFCALPVLVRWSSRPEAGEHAFSAAFGARAPLGAQRRHALATYAVAHLPGLATAILLVASFFAPDTFGRRWVLPAVLGLGFLIIAILRRPSTWRAFDPQRATRTLIVVIYSNLVLISWTAMLAKIVLDTLTPNAADLPDLAAALLAALVVLTLLAMHLLATFMDMALACAMITLVAVTVLCLPGDLAFTALALRVSQLGGGRPMVYRSEKDGAPIAACEVLAIGDSRIVWAPAKTGEIQPATTASEPPKAKTAPSPTCDWSRFRTRLSDGANWAAKGDPAAADAVRVFRREDLYDKP